MGYEKEPGRQYVWKDDLLAALMLTGFAFLINHGISIKGLYMDDLYLWSCYGEQSFLQYVFPMGSTRFRFLYYLAAWLELAVTGNHVEWFVPVNILLNGGVAFTLYRMARRMSRSTYVGILCGIAYLASRMSYYQIGQVYGLMETMALWMAIGILYLLFLYHQAQAGEGGRFFRWANILYFSICFVHERYMVLLPLFFLVLLMQKEKNRRLTLAPAGSFLLVQIIRKVTIGGLAPAGTGGTDVVDTFSMGSAIRYALSQVAYVFGINAGPDYLNGENIRQSPLWVWVLLGLANLMLLMLVVSFVYKMFRCGKACCSYLGTSLLFLGFIAGCIACSSVTIRVELRWVYVSFAAALLYLAWIYGVLTDGMTEREHWLDALPFLGMLSLFVLLMLPVEVHYRQMYPNVYFWANQNRYNSLAEETYEKYGDDIFGKTIYIIGNEYEMSDFTANTFFKVFDKERKAEGTQVVHINDVRDIGLIDSNMLVLREERSADSFQDVTGMVKELKCHSPFGYYEDGWLDERAEIQVMTGKSGIIELMFFYPREVQAEQWITVLVDGEPVQYLMFTDNQLTAAIEAQPYQTVTLGFETNFYIPGAQEQRGDYRLATLLTLQAD